MGWQIEVHDELGEFASYVRPEAISAAGDAEPSSQGGANKWHIAIVLGRPSPAVDGQQRHNPDSGDSPTARGTASVNGLAESRDPAADGANAEARRDSGEDVDSSVFEIKFESGRMATLDLSHFSIRWITLWGQDLGSTAVAHDEGHPDANSSASGNAGGGGPGGGGLPSSRPPGFESLEDLSGPLANSQADIGTRVDVWWPRYNSYFRATVSESPSHEKSVACRTPSLYRILRRVHKMQACIISKKIVVRCRLLYSGLWRRQGVLAGFLRERVRRECLKMVMQVIFVRRERVRPDTVNHTSTDVMNPISTQINVHILSAKKQDVFFLHPT